MGRRITGCSKKRDSNVVRQDSVVALRLKPQLGQGESSIPPWSISHPPTDQTIPRARITRYMCKRAMRATAAPGTDSSTSGALGQFIPPVTPDRVIRDKRRRDHTRRLRLGVDPLTTSPESHRLLFIYDYADRMQDTRRAMMRMPRTHVAPPPSSPALHQLTNPLTRTKRNGNGKHVTWPPGTGPGLGLSRETYRPEDLSNYPHRNNTD